MKNFILLITIIGFSVFSSPLISQTSTIGNTSSSPTDYLGWEASVTFPLNIRHKGTEPLRFATHNIEHMRVTAQGQFWVGAQGLFNARANVYGSQVGVLQNFAIAVKSVNGATAAGRFLAANASAANVAVRGKCYGENDANLGLYGEVCNPSQSGPRSFAIFGDIPGACPGATYAGYFEGNTFSPGGVWSASDESLKLNIQELSGCLSLVDALSPKSYIFKEDFSHMQLPEGTQYGLLAQNLSSVIPHAVSSIVNPADYDDAGNLINERVEFDGVNYSQLIPVLIGAFQERQALIDQQEATIAELEERVAQAEAQAFILSQSE